MWHPFQNKHIRRAAKIIRSGGVIAYPTEAVYGLGCDPFNMSAVKRLAAIKGRPLDKGFILIAAYWKHVAHLTQNIDPALLQKRLATEPGPITWIFPATCAAPSWVCGSCPSYRTVAIRITTHPIARALSKAIDGPLISTSANHAGENPIRQWDTLAHIFGQEIDYCVPGALGDAKNPSEIRDVITNEIFRAG